MKKAYRRCAAVLCSLCLCVLSAAAPVKAREAISVSARSAVLLSADTGEVLWEKDAHQRLPMASTTKVMTALLTLEEAARTGDPPVDITAEMVAVEGSSMGLQRGDRLTLTNLCTGMLLASGNDAANAAALYLSGSREEFASLMNRRAAELGMENTHFVTPSGLDDEAHYSTAYDMALLTRAALKNAEFLRLCSSFTSQVEFLRPEKKAAYTNHNKLLKAYQGCIGVKTGFTKKAGRCLISAARRDGVTLIAVTLNAPDDWNDHKALLDHGFSLMEAVSFNGAEFFARVPVVGSDMQSIAVQGSFGATVPLRKEDAGRITCRAMLPTFLYAPVAEGSQVGRLQYCCDGRELYSIPILARENAALPPRKPGFWERLTGRGP